MRAPRPSRLLASLFTVGGRPALVEVDLWAPSVRPVPVEPPPGAARLTGLSVGATVVALHAAAERQTWLGLIDRASLRTLTWTLLPGVADGHSVVLRDHDVVVASTGTSEVVTFAFDGATLGEGTVLWRPPDGGGGGHHVNCLTTWGDRLVASAFGPSPTGRRGDAVDGYLVDCGTGEVLRTGLHHPHSPLALGDDLWFCESQAAVVRRLGGPTALPTWGYARGLVGIGDDRVGVGSSFGRPGWSDRPQLGWTTREPWCGVEVFDLGGAGCVERIDLAAHGEEVFDLVAL